MILLPIFFPFIAALILGLVGAPKGGAIANAALSLAVFLLSLAAFSAPGSGLIHADALGLLFGALTGFIAFTTSLANIAYVRGAEARLTPKLWRLYHALWQIVLGASLLGMYADNTGLLWVAVEIATIAAALAISLPGTAPALEAAWKYLILGGAGIALALFGTMLVYLAAQPILGPGLASMSFAALSTHAPGMDGALLTLAFVFIVFGYGTKAALVPMRGWLHGAYAEFPAPLNIALSGGMLNLVLIAILRFRHLLQANAAAGGTAMPPGPFLLVLGLASLFFAGLALSRRRDARRFPGFSSIMQAGIAVFAFGIGGPAAIFGGLLHMLLQALISSALFIALIRTAALRGNYAFSHLRGLIHANRYTAWLLGGALFALTGLPPSGLFAPEFIIISQTVQRSPWVSAPLALGLLLCAVAICRGIGPLIFGQAPPHIKPVKTSPEMHLVALHLALVVLLAFAMPGPLLHLLSAAAGALQ